MKVRCALGVVLIAVGGLQAQPRYRVDFQTWPSGPVAGHPATIEINAGKLLETPDPLLGSDLPFTDPISIEIRDPGGRDLTPQPLRLDGDAENGGIFRVEHLFRTPGLYTLLATLHDADGSSERRQINLTVRQDPYAWVFTVSWMLLAVLTLPLAVWGWRKRSGAPRFGALAMVAIFSLLCGLLFQQYLAPSARRALLHAESGDPLPGQAPRTADFDMSPSKPLQLSFSGVEAQARAEILPALQAGIPSRIRVFPRNPEGQPLPGQLHGFLELTGNAESAAAPSPHEHHHGMEGASSPAPAMGLRPVFEKTADGGFEATVLPVAPGDYRLSLHFMNDSIHASWRSDTLTAGGEGAAPHDHGAMAAQGWRPSLALYAILLAAVGIPALAAGVALRQSTPRGLDLFRWRTLYRAYRSRYFQPALWTPNLLIFSLVIYLGIWDTRIGGRNLATKLTWTLWWAAIIFAFVFAGKIWCAMCPFGALTTWTSRLFGSVRKLPRWLRNIWIANLAFFFVTWADDYWGIVSNPYYTALVVIVVSLAAVAVGFAFERATFCRHLCPIGGLIGIYSMFSGLELRSRSRDVCRACEGKECYAGAEHLPGCPMMQFPSMMERNNYCNLCGDCVKACPHDNLALRTRAFGKDIWNSAKRHMDEAFLAISLVGLTIVVTGHMIEPWHGWMDTLAGWIDWPRFGVADHAAIEKATFTFVYVAGVLILSPVLLLLASWVSRFGAGGRLPAGTLFRTFAYMFIPVGIALHLAHNLLHLLKEGPGVVPVIQRAAVKYLGIGSGNINWSQPALMTDVSIYWVQMGVLSIFYVAAVYLGGRIAIRTSGDRRTAVLTLMPMVLLALGFTLLNIFLLSQPMSARHHH